MAHSRRNDRFRACRTALALVITCSLLWWAGPASSAQTLSDLTLQGVVCDRAGTPVGGAYLQAQGFETRADSSGHYVLHLLSGTQILVTAWAPGYTRIPVVFSSSSGGPLTGTMTADFTGHAALSSAFQDPATHAVLSGLPARLPARVHRVHIAGTSQVPLESRIAITLPGGNVTTVPLHQRGTHFDATIPFPSKGAYWVEVNAVSGFAIFNVLVFHGVRPQPPLDPSFPPEPAWGQVTPQQLGQYALYLINNVRQTAGRKALVMQPALLRAAQAHNRDIIRFGYYEVHPHIGSDGSTPWQRMSRAGLRLYGAGEAVGEASTVGTVIAEFLQSPSHRAILLGRYRWAGIGVSRTNGALLVTVDLAR